MPITITVKETPLFAVALLSMLPSASLADEIAEEILVTARGRAEDVRLLPDTITAFSAPALREREARTIDDLIALTPGVYMINDQDPGTNLISVRGVSTDRLQAPSVAYVIDSVPLADTEFFTARYFDLERVEVLKGPQGALYGKNAIGGVFNVITRRPSDTLTGNIDVGYGNGDSVLVEGGVGGPLGSDKLLFRAAGSYATTDGFIYSTYLNKHVDYYTSRNLRLTLLGKLSEDVTAELRVGYMNEEGGAAYVSSNDVTGLNNGKLSGAVLTDPFGDFEGQADRQWTNAAAKINWTPTFGGVAQLIGAYDDYSKDFVEELDFRHDKPITFLGLPFFPDGIQPIYQPKDFKVWTGEARYTSPDDQRARWIVGAFIQDVTNIRVDDFGPLLFGAEAARYRTLSTQTAVFGQISVDLTDALELTGALRYDRDNRRVTVRGVDTGALVEAREKVFDKVTPKISLAYRVTADHLLYATYGQGFKTGGFNPPPGPGDIHQSVFRPEKTKAFEAGVKTGWLAGRLLLDLAAFKTNYQDYQYFAFINGLDLAFNIDKVNVWGLEAAATASLSETLSVDIGYAYTHAEIDAFTAPNPVTLIATDYAGNRTPNTPRSTLNIGGTYRQPLANGANLVARVDYARVGRINYEIDNVLYSPGRDSVDARAAYETAHWSLALWGKNLTNNRWAISAFGQRQIGLLAFLGPNGPFDSFSINKGRQYGATLSARF